MNQKITKKFVFCVRGAENQTPPQPQQVERFVWKSHDKVNQASCLRNNCGCLLCPALPPKKFTKGFFGNLNKNNFLYLYSGCWIVSIKWPFDEQSKVRLPTDQKLHSLLCSFNSSLMCLSAG